MTVAYETNASADAALAQIAVCLADAARARILCCLMDARARTATELATVAGVAASTASAHLARLEAQGLVSCVAQGRYRYYSLANAHVGSAVESLLVLAGFHGQHFVPSTPEPLREARRCYDHLAGYWGVRLHDHAVDQRWIVVETDRPTHYRLTQAGSLALEALGVDVAAARDARRRRLACPCMDWSERRPHLGGALGAAWLQALLQQGWFVPDLDSRALRPTRRGLRRLDSLLVDRNKPAC